MPHLTPTPEIVVVDDTIAMGRLAARRVRRSATVAFLSRGGWRIALAGGATPRALYRELAGADGGERIDWDRTEIFFGDERAVPPDHADSNYRMVCESLLARTVIPPAKLHRMEAEALDLDAAAARYAEELGDAPLDLAILGMGTDGHTASLFPNSPALGEGQRRCVAVTAPPTARPAVRRMTLTHPVFATAREVIFLIAGADKSLTLKRVIEGPDCPEALPCQAIVRRAAPVIIFCDRGAAAELSTISRPSG
ncbi:MAG TPA: 6-phosphogluconolactonase [Polyangia bacterium]|jgi:6-phosphogluconolactonase|nr:6-phosphogluconolactonase [Polyangia bacterium]